MLRCQIIPKHDVAFYIPLEISAVLVRRRQMIHFSVRVMLNSPEAVFSSRLEFGQNSLRAPASTVEGEGL